MKVHDIEETDITRAASCLEYADRMECIMILARLDNRIQVQDNNMSFEDATLATAAGTLLNQYRQQD